MDAGCNDQRFNNSEGVQRLRSGERVPDRQPVQYVFEMFAIFLFTDISKD